jgi:hypothetical protein
LALSFHLDLLGSRSAKDILTNTLYKFLVSFIRATHKSSQRPLFSHLSNTDYERILANKLTKEIDTKLEEEQYAFRGGRATTDLILPQGK